MRTLVTMAALGGAILIAACGAETDIDAEAPAVAAKPVQELPPIEVREGDGLPAHAAGGPDVGDQR